MGNELLECPDNAKQAIERLRVQGYEPTLDHIAMLIELGNRVQNPPHRTNPALAGIGIRAGTNGPRFMPLSIEGGLWFDRAEPRMDNRMMAFAYASDSANAGTFANLYSMPSANIALQAYERTLSCSPDELQSALERLIDEDTPADEIRAERAKKNEDPPAFDMSEAVARMVAATGLPAEHWLSEPLEHGMAVLTAAMESNAGMFGGVSDHDPEYERNCFEFAAAVQHVEAECKAAMDAQAVTHGE